MKKRKHIGRGRHKRTSSLGINGTVTILILGDIIRINPEGKL